jgi:hypothetical protein
VVRVRIMYRVNLLTLTVLALGLVRPVAASDTPASVPEVRSPAEAAAEIDRLLEESFTRQGMTPAPLTSDGDFLRRLTLDLAGTIPTVNEAVAFGIDPDAAKREVLINRLLKSPEFATTWGAYFREVVLSRATETRARAAQSALEDWLAAQIENDRGWDEITTDLLTSTGDVMETGHGTLMFAHDGDPAELAGEVSRIFLGIQIQCANCHDHPYDSWKREQFHQLAAYFPRVTVRQDLQSQPPTFTVASADFQERRGMMMRSDADPAQAFRVLDRDRDGMVTKDEAGQRGGPLGRQFDRVLTNFDADSNGGISLTEFEAARMQAQARPGRGSAEYYMPSLTDPASQGTLIEPTFFVDHAAIEEGADDLERRSALAASITSRDNPWFARAFVNRVWTELMGEGFYTPVDDLGPERSARNPEVLAILANGFVASDYNIRWVFETTVRTRAYQRALGTRGPGETSPAFAAAVPIRLRSDQIYHATCQALGIEQIGRRSGIRGQINGAMPILRRLQNEAPGRVAFFGLFNFDPSTPQDEVLGNVPQALFLMNSSLLQNLISGYGRTALAQTLQRYPDDRDALSEIYLRTLSREPTDDEIQTCRDYIVVQPTRQQAFEDIQWCLLNSSEFVTRR